ncbi:Alba domain-containing protein [Citrus sinensis]|uniref:Alba domain-containing protein n=1 Tax=Citrus sinensis TaxID=2711 RepID=A0ACB8KCB6_CITSI|nr:Alba domain-containing protein [Citrus sinensis]
MDRYQKVEKPKTETAISENELRITAQGRLRNYISYAISLLEEKGANEVVLKATGRAINKTVMIAELLKRRVVGLHQNTSTGSIDITDVWEPLEEGLLPLETTRHVSAITITLSRKELDSSSLGYQPPVPTDQVKPLADYDDGRGNNNGVPEYNNGHWDGGAGYGGRGRGRAAGRSFWGHGRRYDGNMHQESEYYNGYGGSGALPPQGRDTLSDTVINFSYKMINYVDAVIHVCLYEGAVVVDLEGLVAVVKVRVSDPMHWSKKLPEGYRLLRSCGGGGGGRSSDGDDDELLVDEDK